MKRVLVDSSVWINFFNSKNSSSEIILLQELILKNSSMICICPVIYQEILQGIKNDNTFKQIKDILSDFNMLNIEIMEVTNYAVDLYRRLRKMGVTIRKSADCLIASYAILGDMYLLQNDKDFTEIAKGSRLRIFT